MMTRLRARLASVLSAAALALLAAAASGPAAQAQENPFANGWTLQSEASAIRFQSVKNGSKVEQSSFATFDGAISETGAANVRVLLDSVDTKIDLRNVRMRFLFFETFQYPEANVSLQLNPADVVDLPETRRKVLTVPYTLSLHGVEKTLEAEIAVTLISSDLIAVSSSTPITLSVADFNLMGGIEKLQEAANVTIVPSSTVTFDFVFSRNAGDAAPQVAAVETQEVQPRNVALEAEGNFDDEACVGRFEILSRSDSVNFRSGSAQIEDTSTLFLDSVVDIVQRCPDLTIAVEGHTDSVGSDSSNQRLSERRASSVAQFITARGVEQARVQTVGYGEARPIVPNTSAENRGRNRRIEFAVVQ